MFFHRCHVVATSRASGSESARANVAFKQPLICAPSIWMIIWQIGMAMGSEKRWKDRRTKDALCAISRLGMQDEYA